MEHMDYAAFRRELREVFADCNLIRLRTVTPMRVCFNILKTGDKVKLSDSEVYRRIQGD